MSQSSYPKYAQQLQQLMQQVGVSSLKELSQRSGLSQWQLTRLEYGLLPKMSVETLVKFSNALQIPVTQLIEMFSPDSPTLPKNEETSELRQEYDRLQQELEQQKKQLHQEFQRMSLDILESWLIYWPSAAAAVQENPNFPAERLLPLLKPIEALLTEWGVEKIGAVGENVSYNPQDHQLMEGESQPGDIVKVRYVGYRQGNKLLHRAKVSPVAIAT
ncbi:MAG: helix-turn-helix domain-containing protein [Chroococcales cyanobacterium]